MVGNMSGSLPGQCESGSTYGFMLEPDGTWTCLGTGPGGNSSRAYAINDAGVIVGSQAYLKRGVPVFKAVIWTSADSVDDLNSKVNLGASETLEDALRLARHRFLIERLHFGQQFATKEDVR